MTDALWYLGRGTGVVSLVLLTLVVALGIATRSGRPLPGLPRFGVTALHRSASLLAVAFVAAHVGTLLYRRSRVAPDRRTHRRPRRVPPSRRHPAAGPQRAARLRTRPRIQHRSQRVSALHIDWTRCRGRGGCAELLAELIGRDGRAYPVAATDTVIPRALGRPARQAVRDCPQLALHLIAAPDRA